MFDQVTAQSCWAGPGGKINSPSRTGEFEDGELTPEQSAELGLNAQTNLTSQNPADLPFCKDLK